MGLRPTRVDEDPLRRRPRESGGPFSVRKTMDSRFRGNDTRGAIFRRDMSSDATVVGFL